MAAGGKKPVVIWDVPEPRSDEEGGRGSPHPHALRKHIKDTVVNFRRMMDPKSCEAIEHAEKGFVALTRRKFFKQGYVLGKFVIKPTNPYFGGATTFCS
jgi:hypothetical protein